MVVDVLTARNVILNDRFVVAPPKRFDPIHFFPGWAAVGERYRNVFELWKWKAGGLPIRRIADDHSKITAHARENERAVS